MRPIDADKFAKLIKEFKNDAPNSEARKYVCNTLLSMLGDENQTPTIDPSNLVRRGQWEVKHNPIDDPKGYFIRIVCSECNLHTGQKSNYCPHCGARMEKEEDEE